MTRLRLWMERGQNGFFLRDAESGEALRWEDGAGRFHVVPLAGASYRQEEIQGDDFAPGARLTLVREPDNEHDPNAVAVWDADRRVQGGYVPAEVAPELVGDEQAFALWEFRDDAGARVGLRVLIVPSDAWVGAPR
jgi:hypothetical protein